MEVVKIAGRVGAMGVASGREVYSLAWILSGSLWAVITWTGPFRAFLSFSSLRSFFLLHCRHQRLTHPTSRGESAEF